MLTTNTMRYGTDNFQFRKQALIYGVALNGADITAAEGFNI